MSSGEIAADLEMRSVKLDALEKGRHTDFTFLVGPDKEVRFLNFRTQLDIDCGHFLQVVHCLKGDLLMASEYFESLIRSGEPYPVHIKLIQPHIFKMLIRYEFHKPCLCLFFGFFALRLYDLKFM